MMFWRKHKCPVVIKPSKIHALKGGRPTQRELTFDRVDLHVQNTKMLQNAFILIFTGDLRRK